MQVIFKTSAGFNGADAFSERAEKYLGVVISLLSLYSPALQSGNGFPFKQNSGLY